VNTVGINQINEGALPFDTLALDYDSWFDNQGKLIFALSLPLN